MRWINLVVGARSLHNADKSYVDIVNAITTFVEPTSPTNIITNETILTQKSIKQGIDIFEKKDRLQCKNNFNSLVTTCLRSK